VVFRHEELPFVKATETGSSYLVWNPFKGLRIAILAAQESRKKMGCVEFSSSLLLLIRPEPIKFLPAAGRTYRRKEPETLSKGSPVLYSSF